MILLLLAILVLVFLVHQLWYRRLGLPPGPFPLPLIGNVHSLWSLERWENKFLEWREQYGTIYTYWFGFDYVITVNDYKTAVDMFVKDGDTYADRAPTEILDHATRGGMFGIIESSGAMWLEQRRFALKVLRDFGLSKNRMQDRILEEIDVLYQNIDLEIESGADEIDFHRYTDIATGSIINNVVNGYSFTIDNKSEEFYRLKETATKFMRCFSNPLVQLASIYPLLNKLPVVKGYFEEIVGYSNQILHFLEGIIDEHAKTQDYSEEMEPRDFVDAYLMEMKRREKHGDIGYFSKHQLKNVLMDLWMAGQETTSTTLTWAIAYLIRYPEVQKKIQDELDQFVGENRVITVSDKINLPYTNATIMEVQRCANIIPQNIPRRTTRVVKVNGYQIPKGTVIIPQISVMLIDPNTYEDPQKFNPSRFIDNRGNLKKADELVPFSIGKRQCLGEGLARMELFLFVANLLHRYEFLPGAEPPTLGKATPGFSLATKEYTCRVRRR